jgi:hypothetical protein
MKQFEIIETTDYILAVSDEQVKEGDFVVEIHTFKREPYIGKCFYPKNDGTVTDEILKRDLLSVNYEGHYETLARPHNCKKIIAYQPKGNAPELDLPLLPEIDRE